jgi:hypothetical protein
VSPTHQRMEMIGQKSGPHMSKPCQRRPRRQIKADDKDLDLMWTNYQVWGSWCAFWEFGTYMTPAKLKDRPWILLRKKLYNTLHKDLHSNIYYYWYILYCTIYVELAYYYWYILSCTTYVELTWLQLFPIFEPGGILILILNCFPTFRPLGFS